MKKYLLSLILLPLLLSTSCSNKNSSSIVIDTVIKSPNEDGGLEGNADKDTVEAQDPSVLKDFLLNVSNEKYYKYEITANIQGNESHFVNYTTPYAWYEENDDPSLSFGYAEEFNTGAVFKYYLDEENNTAIPSIYEYVGIGDSISKLTGLYSPLTITHVNLFQSNMDEFSAISEGTNKFLITDSNTASIFQFLTTFGNSITNFINAVYVEILDEEGLQFRSICDLGELGTIEGIFTPTKNLKNAFIHDLIVTGKLKGVDYHEDVNDFFTKVMPSNNFVLHGIKQNANILENNDDPYTIHCTKEYFFLEYSLELQKQGYQNFGYVYFPKNTTVTYKEDVNGVPMNKTQTLSYSACYSFFQNNNGEFVIDKFIGPTENGATKYKEVDQLPETGDYNTFYIVEENGIKVAYEYREISNGVFGWALYDNWFNSVGDFPINGVMASFYVGSTALAKIGSLYFEQNLKNPNEYYSKDLSVIGVLANGLFGWGFQHTDTWMDFIETAKLKVNKNLTNEILSYDLCLDVRARLNGGEEELHEISYNIDSFGSANVVEVDNFLNKIKGGKI